MNNDLISRAALKTAIEDRIDYVPSNDYDEGWNNAIYAVIDEIDNAPTVNDCPNCEYKLEADYIRSSSSYKELIDLRKFKEENTRPQGKWTIVDDVYCECPFCKNREVKFSKYCPECGAYMRKGDET